MRVLLRAAAMAGGAYLMGRYLDPLSSPLATAACGACLVYVVFSLLDGCELTPKGRVWPAFVKGPIPRFLLGPKGIWQGRMVYEDKEALRSTKQCIFAAFPHGILSFHHALMSTDADNFVTDFPQLSLHNRRDLAASVVFLIPLWRELLLWMGCVDAGKRTAKAILKKGWSLYVLPGGEMEQMLTQEGEHHIYLKKRKGFIKLSLEFGMDLVPVYGFGETDMYTTYNILRKTRMWICKNLRVALPLATGIGPTLLPKPVPISCVVGTPIHVEKDPNPSQEAIDALHSKFTQAVLHLFDKYHTDFCEPGTKLHVH